MINHIMLFSSNSRILKNKSRKEVFLMNNQEQNNYLSALSPSNFSAEYMSNATKRQIHKDSCEVVRTVVRKNMIENGMAFITNTAMNNIANWAIIIKITKRIKACLKFS